MVDTKQFQGSHDNKRTVMSVSIKFEKQEPKLDVINKIKNCFINTLVLAHGSTQSR